MTKKEKRERLAEAAERLGRLYPNAECALQYEGDPWRLLVMGRLSAQCTDARVNLTARELFERYPNAATMAAAELADIEAIIMPCGLYKMKAKNIRDASRMLVEDYGGVLPNEMDELLKLPGVGRKIANLLLGDVFGAPCVVCDTHCIRICGRLGMYPESEKDPVRVERILRSLLDVERGAEFCHRIVLHGRAVCTARAPRCEACELSDVCRHAQRLARRGEVRDEG